MGEHAEPRNTSGRLREAIENAILAGQYQLGERLDEATLASRFAVSRTPIREALHQLATSGTVEIRPRRGAVVATPSPERLYEMFEVMAELEAMCARLAARRMGEEALAELRGLHERSRAELAAPDAYYAENELFHRLIYRASGNTFLVEQAEALQKRLSPFRRLQLRVRNRLATSFAEHGAIIEALGAGDGETASRLMRAHVRVQGERFSDLVAGLARMRAA